MNTTKELNARPGVPYSPCGGRKALLSILNSGGFVNYDSLEFTNPISEN